MTPSRPLFLTLFITLLLGQGSLHAAILDVNEGDSIQAAVEAAQPGDTITDQPWKPQEVGGRKPTATPPPLPKTSTHTDMGDEKPAKDQPAKK